MKKKIVNPYEVYRLANKDVSRLQLNLAKPTFDLFNRYLFKKASERAKKNNFGFVLTDLCVFKISFETDSLL